MNQDQIHIIIHQYLTQALSAEERVNVETWLAENEANQSLFDSIKLCWDLSEGLKDDFDVDTPKAWAKFSNRIDQEAPLKSGKIVSFKWAIRAVAAAVLLVGGWFISQQFLNNANTFVAESGVEKVQLADGSFVWLNEGAQLQVESFDGKDTRLVHLKGEAFFEVAADKTQPFIIKTPQTEVKVIGTAFNVIAKPNETHTIVKVISGTVQFKGKSSQPVILKQRDYARYAHQSNQMEKSLVKDLNSISWKTGILSFRNKPVSEAIQAIENHYDVQIDRKVLSISDCPLNATFNGSSIEEVMASLKTAFTAEIRKVDDRNYQILGGTCTVE